MVYSHAGVSRILGGHISMSQTSIIFGALIVGFIVYVTIKGRLPMYAAVLFGGVKGTNAASDKGAATNMPTMPTTLPPPPTFN